MFNRVIGFVSWTDGAAATPISGVSTALDGEGVSIITEGTKSGVTITDNITFVLPFILGVLWI